MVEMHQLVTNAIALAEAADRQDLAQRLEQTRTGMDDPVTRVVIAGEFKQGKSMLLNALVDAPVSRVDDVLATAVPTTVRFGDPASASVLVGRDGTLAGPAKREDVDLDSLAGRVAGSSDIVAVDVALPRRILEDGLTLTDSPGVGGAGSTHTLATLTSLPNADAMLFVSDASQEYTEPEIQFLEQAMRVCPNIACVLTKIDLHPHWRTIAELNRKHLDAVDPRIPLYAVSSELRSHAARAGDAELNAESGFPALVGYLRQNIVGRATRLRQRSVAQEVLSATEHLSIALQGELVTLQDPAGAAALVAGLEAAKERANELRRTSARWQVTLKDGMDDLIADMDHDLRDRMRSVQREAERAIDAADPGPGWDDLVDWLEQRIESAISDTFVWTNERARWLSGEVAVHFREGDVALPTLAVEHTEDVMDGVELFPELESGRLSPVDKVLIGMRGSYGGVLMAGLITGIMGMALINPISVAAGVIIGAKSYHDDKLARLKRRQTDAKAIVRRQVDDVVFHVGKQLKDRLRLVQRTTRDHFTDIAEEYHRSLADSVAATAKAQSTVVADRQGRVSELSRELERVRQIASEAERLKSGARPLAEAAA